MIVTNSLVTAGNWTAELKPLHKMNSNYSTGDFKCFLFLQTSKTCPMLCAHLLPGPRPSIPSVPPPPPTPRSHGWWPHSVCVSISALRTHNILCFVLLLVVLIYCSLFSPQRPRPSASALLVLQPPPPQCAPCPSTNMLLVCATPSNTWPPNHRLPCSR